MCFSNLKVVMTLPAAILAVLLQGDVNDVENRKNERPAPLNTQGTCYVFNNNNNNIDVKNMFSFTFVLKHLNNIRWVESEYTNGQRSQPALWQPPWRKVTKLKFVFQVRKN